MCRLPARRWCTLHKTIQAVTTDLENLSCNTAIARLMEFVNYFNKQSVRPRAAMEAFVLLLSPMAPHIAEELWQLLGHKATLAYEPWPVHDPALTVEDTVEIPVQIKGKLRRGSGFQPGPDRMRSKRLPAPMIASPNCCTINRS